MARSTIIKNFTHIIGESQGYIPLHIRREIASYPDAGEMPITSISFELTDTEIKAHQAGEPIILTLLGHDVPPMLMTVGDPSDTDAQNG